MITITFIMLVLLFAIVSPIIFTMAHHASHAKDKIAMLSVAFFLNILVLSGLVTSLFYDGSSILLGLLCIVFMLFYTSFTVVDLINSIAVYRLQYVNTSLKELIDLLEKAREEALKKVPKEEAEKTPINPMIN